MTISAQIAQTTSLGCTRAFDNNFVAVDEHKVVFPNGNLGSHAVVHTSTDHGAVIIPVYVDRGLAYFGLAQQHRFALGAHTYEFPRGGTTDLSEDEALREVVEEMGSAPRRFGLVGTLHPDTGLMPVKVGMWIALMDKSIRSSDYVELETGLSMQWVRESEITELIAGGKITCGMTIAGYAFWMLNRSRYGSLLV